MLTDFNNVLMCFMVKKLDVNTFSFAHFTLILLLHYLVKCRSRSLTMSGACIGSEMIN